MSGNAGLNSEVSSLQARYHTVGGETYRYVPVVTVGNSQEAYESRDEITAIFSKNCFNRFAESPGKEGTTPIEKKVAIINQESLAGAQPRATSQPQQGSGKLRFSSADRENGFRTATQREGGLKATEKSESEAEAFEKMKKLAAERFPKPDSIVTKSNEPSKLIVCAKEKKKEPQPIQTPVSGTTQKKGKGCSIS